MAFIPVANTLEAVLVQSLGGEQLVNTLYFEKDSATNTADLANLAAALRLWWTGGIDTWLCDDLCLNQINIRDLTVEAGGILNYTTSLPACGAVTAEAPLPANVAICVSFRTGLAGRSYRGRNYIAGVSEAQVTINTLGDTIQAGLLAAYEDLLGAGGLLANFTWVVVSRYHNNAARVAGVTTEITSVIVNKRVDTQRRRLPRSV